MCGLRLSQARSSQWWRTRLPWKMRFMVTDLWNPTHILEKSCFFHTQSGDKIKHGVGLKKGLHPSNLGSKTPLNRPYFQLEIGHKLEDWFLTLGVFSRSGTTEIWQESHARLKPLCFLIPWTPIFSVNSLGPKHCYQPIRSLIKPRFGVPLVLDHSVNPQKASQRMYSMSTLT